jgi:type IV pilus assembly protein PilB
MALIGELIQRGILEEKIGLALVEEAKNLGKREEEIILEKEILSEEVLFQIKSEILNIPLKRIEPEKISPELFKLIPEETAKYYKIVPLEKKGETLSVGMVYPEDLTSQEALSFLARIENFNYRVFLITPTTFKNILEYYRHPKREVEKVLGELETILKEEKISPIVGFEKIVEEEAPISKIVAVILKYAVEGAASDIHIEPLRNKLRVRFRKLGILHSSFFLPIRILPAIVARVRFCLI